MRPQHLLEDLAFRFDVGLRWGAKAKRPAALKVSSSVAAAWMCYFFSVVLSSCQDFQTLTVDFQALREKTITRFGLVPP